ncbi:hypothetical protein RYH73_01235 [Olivibacter sp. CPCC 100613]|uniref:hypothetical protein n=1 Tax=Olivibacter sp. CPCC 100613 TaxID=3079931 RepID=UPI002FF88082
MIPKKLDLLIDIARELLVVLKQILERPALSTVLMKGNPAIRILDNADIKQLLKIGDTKLYYLKKKKILKPYKLDGKDIYLEHEVIEAIKKSSEF